MWRRTAPLAQVLQTIFPIDMPATHHHRRVLLCRLEFRTGHGKTEWYRFSGGKKFDLGQSMRVKANLKDRGGGKERGARKYHSGDDWCRFSLLCQAGAHPTYGRPSVPLRDSRASPPSHRHHLRQRRPQQYYYCRCHRRPLRHRVTCSRTWWCQ